MEGQISHSISKDGHSLVIKLPW